MLLCVPFLGFSQIVTQNGELIYEYRLSPTAAPVYTTVVDPRGVPEGWSFEVVANRANAASQLPDYKHVFCEVKTGLKTNVDPR